MTKTKGTNVFYRTRKVITAISVAGVILSVSACGGSAGDSAPVEPSVQPSSSATATAAPTAAKVTDVIGAPSNTGAKPGDLVNGLPTKTELANDGKGDYIQTTIASDDPALTYNPAIVDSTVTSVYSEADVKDFQKFIVKFIAEETIDSTLNDNPGDSATQEAWWAKNKSKFEPSNQAELYSTVKANDPNKPIVFRGQFRGAKYSLSNGANKTHVYSRKITPTKIKAGVQNGQKLIALQADVEFVLNVTHKGQKTVESSNGQVSYTAVKSSSGEWLITGYYSNFNSTPVA